MSSLPNLPLQTFSSFGFLQHILCRCSQYKVLSSSLRIELSSISWQFNLVQEISPHILEEITPDSVSSHIQHHSFCQLNTLSSVPEDTSPGGSTSPRWSSPSVFCSSVGHTLLCIHSGQSPFRSSVSLSFLWAPTWQQVRVVSPGTTRWQYTVSYAPIAKNHLL